MLRKFTMVVTSPDTSSLGIIKKMKKINTNIKPANSIIFLFLWLPRTFLQNKNKRRISMGKIKRKRGPVVQDMVFQLHI